MTNSILRTTNVLLAVWTAMAVAQILPEESARMPGSDQPLPFQSKASIISSNPDVTVLEIIITPTDHHRLPTDRQTGLGLVAVSHTGRIRATAVEVEASRLSDPERVQPLSADELPSTLIQLGEPAIWRDIRVVTVGIAPSWGKEDDALLARRVVLNIENIGGDGINEKTRPAQPVSPIWDRLYARHVLNYESLDLPHLDRGTGNRYIVVSRTLFEDAAPQFVEWKTAQGYGVDLVTLEGLGYTNPSAEATMDGVKNYIFQAYNDWPETPEFVLLLGDISNSGIDGSIWTKKFYNSFYSQGYMYHDQWYALLEGDDVFPDIMVGRFPDSNAQRMDYQLQKTIGYEREPYIDGSWQKNALMTLKSGYTETIDTKNSVSDALSSWGMNVTEKFQNNANPSQILPVVNQGLTFYNYRGDYCSSTDWYGTFGSGDVQYVNNVRKIGVWTILSCSSAMFDFNVTTAEELLRHGYATPNNPKGIVAFIGSQAYTAYQYNNPLDKGFYHAWHGQGRSILGKAFVSAKAYAWVHTVGLHQGRRESMMKEYTILGDPSLQVWTDLPQPMIVSVNLPTVPVGQTMNVRVKVTTSDGTPVSAALVCLMKDPDVYVYGYTRGLSGVLLAVNPVEPGEINLTVTAYNLIPHFGSIGVTLTPAPKKPENLAAENDGLGGVLLTWSAVTEDVTGSPITVDHYNVYRNSAAYFPVDDLTPMGSPSTAEFIDTDGVGNSSVNYYYRVTAVSSGGVNSSPSEPAGEFDFDVIQ